MEKVTYPPLINHFKEHAEMYNQLYRAHEIKYGAADPLILSSWVAGIIQPIVQEVAPSSPDKIPQVCKALFTEMLLLIGNQSGIIYEQEYKAAWLLLKENPHLVAVQPGRMVRAINTALESLRTYQPQTVLRWIGSMNDMISYCQSIEEFLSLGRIYAWACGMAHLRKRACEEYMALRKEVQMWLKESSVLQLDIESAFQNEWITLKAPAFVGEAGGFVGYGGNFSASPIVAKVGDEILATDGIHTCAFFADSFGIVLLPDIPVSAGIVVQNSSPQTLTSFMAKHGRGILPFTDISSCVLTDSTFVLTRKNSHHLFVYGWHNG